ncbi:MAG: hypothetical protein HZA18_00835 [Nitrospirae bacterium]|nr:hypothetical protein [Nitrospirota bacterium]
MKKIHFFATILFISFVFIPNTYAHKVQMFAYPEGDTVFVEGYFADGKKPKKSEVMVFDNGGKVLFSGVTDDEGKLSFKIPQKTDLRITLNAGMGHKAEYTLPASELNGSNPPNPPFSKGGEKKMASDKGEETKDVVNQGGDKNEALSKAELAEKGQVNHISQLDEAQVQAIVEKAVERAVGEAIKPLVRSFTEMTQKNSLTTIIGGIGYILGLMGIALYFKSRKGSQS